MKFKHQSKRLTNSFKYAIKGIITGFKQEANLKIHFSFLVIVTILGFVLNISKIEWMICIILYGLVIAAELINTAIEATVDLVTNKYEKQAEIAKDTAAGAVLVIAIISVIIGIMIFLPKIIVLFRR